MKKVKLSYVLTTYNKLPYLKHVIALLLQHKKEDEEIIITEGGGTDGTKEYLSALLASGKIDFVISEKDKGEAHGFNKAILIANGDLIKILSDDDVYYYPAIAACRKYMEENEQIDVVVGNSGTANTEELISPFKNPEMQSEFRKWADGTNRSFYCNGLSLLIRKSSLPLLGLFNTSYLCVDLEYTIRTSVVANYAFYTQFIVTRIINSQSNGSKYAERCAKEQLQLCETYNYPLPATWKVSDTNRVDRSIFWRFKNYINCKLKKWQNRGNEISTDMIIDIIESAPDLQSLYEYHYTQLEKINTNIELRFITRN